MGDAKMDAFEKRLAELERTVAELARKEPRKKDWQQSIGMFKDSEFMWKVEQQMLAVREAEREEARAGRFE